jgi:peptide/nickel transport system permease protein
MSRYTIGRLLMVVPVVLGATLAVFLLTQLAPGDPTSTLLGPNASDSAREELRHSLGLDDPLQEQYVHYLGKLAHGDLGQSIEMRAPVLEVVQDKFSSTLVLGVTAGVAAIVGGIALGVLSAVRQGSILDRATTVGSLFLMSMPAYWLSIVLIYLFAVRLGWFPTGQMYSITGDRGLSDLIWHLVLPATAAAVAPLTIIARVTRSALLEVVRADFLLALRARGVPERVVMLRHALRNALPNIVTMSGLQFGYLLLGSALFVEIVFNWPGIGLQTYNAVASRDFPMIAGVVIISAVVFTLINLLVDLLTAALDPRARV